MFTLPALDLIKYSYPESNIVAIASPQTEALLSRHNFIDEAVLYRKDWRFGKKMSFCTNLSGRFRVMVDFKHTLLPLILRIPKRTVLIRFRFKSPHIKDKNLELISGLIPRQDFAKKDKVEKGRFILSSREKEKWEKYELRNSIFITTVSKSLIKTYPKENLKIVVERLSKKYRVVFIGSRENRQYYEDLGRIDNTINLAGLTNLYDIYYLLKEYSALLLSVDTGILHLGSYLNIAIVALFGPTDFIEYGPWSDNHEILYKADLVCRPCLKARCGNNLECMKNITPGSIIEAVTNILGKIVKK